MNQTSAESLERTRRRYARLVLDLGGIRDPRLEDAFAAVPREDFLPPPPWTIIAAGATERTSDPADLYQDVLVALDRRRGINNGEPALHAAWMKALEPQPGEHIVHVGAGGGYYTAILSTLVAPDGSVDAFEIDPRLAAQAATNLSLYPNASVHPLSAFGRPLPPADIVYVNAGVYAPDPEWLRALTPGGRLIFPWQPSAQWGPAMLVRRHPHGFSARAIMNVGFIVCGGQGRALSGKLTSRGPEATRSVWLASERAPDDTATAIFEEVWFSAEAVED